MKSGIGTAIPTPHKDLKNKVAQHSLFYHDSVKKSTFSKYLFMFYVSSVY